MKKEQINQFTINKGGKPMKKWFALIISSMLLTGCMPALDNNEIVQEENENKKTSIIPSYQISEENYRTLLPYKPSKTRGMVVSNIHSFYDIDEFETGLMRIAQEYFSTNRYLFQEGQILDEDTVRKWLRRKYTPEQLEKLKIPEKDNVGLNPENDEEGTIEEQNENNPIYLAHILEHNYLVRNEQSVELGGIVIGLALNSVHYYQKERYGPTFEYEIPKEDIEREGKRIGEEVFYRLRAMEEVGDVPITIALFEQSSRKSIVPGSFFAYAHAGQGSNTLGEWKEINEKTYLFPSSSAESDHREDHERFLIFKEDIESYFPNYTGIIGRAFYKNDQLINLDIEINIQFHGKGELIGFTQYVTSLVLDQFPDHIKVEVNIQSLTRTEALIVKNPGAEEPIVHIY